jgi:hypothetical protein
VFTATVWIWLGAILASNGPPRGLTQLFVSLMLILGSVVNYWGLRVRESIVGRDRATDVTRLFGDGPTR